MNVPEGPDPSFPFLSENQRFSFPPPEKSPHNSIVAWGGNLSPGMLLSAYEQGLFPWYSKGEPVIWHSPDPRFVIFPEDLHVSSSMKKVLRKGEYRITLDGDFSAVINACSEVPRPGQKGTWISRDVIDGYTELHRLGWAHSAEAWQGDELSGGCYGIRLGNIFYGESMFAKKSNASKAAFLTLADFLFNDELMFIDCQTFTHHLESLGAKEIPRRDYIKILRAALELRKLNGDIDRADRRGRWIL